MLRCITLSLLWLVSLSSYANFNITPISQSISIKEKSASYVLENLTSKKTAYQIYVTTRGVDINGNETREETKDIRIFPSKLILDAAKRKRIKAIYVGKKNISIEKSYRIIFSELDIDVSEAQESTINTRFDFVTSLYITPKNARPYIDSAIVNNEQGEYFVELENSGSQHVLLDDWKLELTNNNGKQTPYEGVLPPVNLLAQSKIRVPLENITGNITDVSVEQ